MMVSCALLFSCVSSTATDTSFGQALAEWKDFYVFVGTAAATLLGLLFVSVSLRLDLFHEAQLADVRDFAAQTFAQFFSLVLIAALFLIPHQQPGGLALPLMLLGVLGLVGLGLVGWESLRLARQGGQDVGPPAWQRGAFFAAPLAAYGGLVAVGLALLGGHTEALIWLAVVAFTLLATAAAGSWILLSHARVG